MVILIVLVTIITFIVVDLILRRIMKRMEEKKIRLEREGAKLPIIVLSASIFDEDIARSKAAGCNRHLGKPLNFEILLETFEEFLPLEWRY